MVRKLVSFKKQRCPWCNRDIAVQGACFRYHARKRGGHDCPGGGVPPEMAAQQFKASAPPETPGDPQEKGPTT